VEIEIAKSFTMVFYCGREGCENHEGHGGKNSHYKMGLIPSR